MVELRKTSAEALAPDWSREAKRPGAWDPGRELLQAIRSYQNASGPLAPLAKKFSVLRHRFWSAIAGADIPLNSRLGGGLLIPHPNGIVIHPDASIGANCLIFQQVTIGSNGHGVPTVGNHVDIGAGAKLIGPIVIGDHARIGANALVREDVPPFGTVVSTPGKLLD